MMRRKLHQEAESYASQAHRTLPGNSHLTGYPRGKSLNLTKVSFYLFALVEMAVFNENPLLDLAVSADKLKDQDFGFDQLTQDALTADFLNQLAARYSVNAIFRVKSLEDSVTLEG